MHGSLSAATLTWDGNTAADGLQDGAGTWNTTATDRWYDPLAVPSAYRAWNNAGGDTALFGAGSEAAGTVALGTAITAGGLTFNAAGSGSYVISGNVLTLSNTGTPIVNATVAASISSALAGTQGMLKTGTGTLTLSGGSANTLTGTTVISGGTLTLSKTSGVTAIAGNIDVQTGGTLAWGTGNNQIADGAALLVSGGTVIFASRSDTFASFTQTAGGHNGVSNAGVIAITGALTMSGGTGITINSNGRWSAGSVDFTGYGTSGSVILLGGDGANSVTRFTVGSGGMIMSGQTITLNRTSAADRLGNELLLEGNITSSGPSRIITSGSGALPAGAVNQLNLGTETRTWNVTADTTTVSLPLAGTGGLTKTGNGILLISGGVSNMNTGLTTVTGGTLALDKTAGIDAVGGNILVNGGTLEWEDSDQIPDGANLTVTSGPTLLLGGRNEVFGSYTQTGGTGFSSSSGNSGIVTIEGTASLSAGGAMTVNSGGRMRVNRFETTGSSRTVLNIGGNNSARITSFTVGEGGMSLTGQNITINLATAGNLGSELILEGNVTATGTNNFNQTNGVAGVAQINLGSAVRTFAINSGTTTSNAPLVGSGGLLKTGNGTLILTIPSTYTGKTTVSGGRLSLTSTGSVADSSWIQVDAGGIFDVSGLTSGFAYAPVSGTRVISGSGSIVGSLTVGGVATLRPGSSLDAGNVATAGDGIGTLSISEDLSFSPTGPQGVATLQIFNSSSADKILVGGDLTLSADSFLTVTLDEDYTPAYGHTWDLIEWSGLLNANGFSLGDNNRSGSDLGNEGNLNLPDLTPWGMLWEIGPFLNAGSLTVTIVPEPGRCLLTGLGILLVGMRRRRA